jgi:hypothetical protein
MQAAILASTMQVSHRVTSMWGDIYIVNAKMANYITHQNWSLFFMSHTAQHNKRLTSLFNTSRSFAISPAHQDEAPSSSLRSDLPGPKTILTLNGDYHHFPQV